MRRLYTVLMYVLIPFLIIRLWWKGRKLPAYRQGWRQRFAFDTTAHEPADVWVHAVSLGEVIAATPVIESILALDQTVLVTVMTPTGLQQVKQRFGERVRVQYVPYDLPYALKRFYQANQIKLGLIMETELWPNLIYFARAAQIPLYLINARLSEKSYQGYRHFKSFFQSVLRNLTAILVQSEADGERFLRLGALPEQVHVLGNVKFDLQTKAVNQEPFAKMREQWGGTRTVVLVASTHEDEEAQILVVWSEVQAQLPGVMLLIAPRHPERFQAIYQLCQQQGWRTGLRSQPATIGPENEVVVLDSLGELMGWYGVCDYAFVGGSFVPVGGHNVLEPIALGKPVVTGPYVHNFKTITDDLLRAEAILVVSDAQNLMEVLIELHSQPQQKQQLVDNASRVMRLNQGVIHRYLSFIGLERNRDAS